MTGQVLPGLLAAEHELLLFAAFWFIVSALDEAAFDIGYLWLRLTGRLREQVIARGAETPELERLTAVFVAAWQEADVIGAMISHTLKAALCRLLRQRSGDAGGGDEGRSGRSARAHRRQRQAWPDYQGRLP